jgi:predicted DNA-binding transcriptional regulator AlpA
MKSFVSSSKPSTSAAQEKSIATIPKEADSKMLPPAFLAIIAKARQHNDHSVLRCKDAAAKAGKGVSTLWRDVKNGVFAPPIKTSARSVAWRVAEIDAVLEAQSLMTRSKQNIDMKVFVAKLTAPPSEVDLAKQISTHDDVPCIHHQMAGRR